MSKGVIFPLRHRLAWLIGLIGLGLLTLLPGTPPVSAGQPTPTWTPPPFRSHQPGAIPQLPDPRRAAHPAPVAAPAALAYYPWSRLAFQSIRDNNWEIYASNDNGSGPTRLTADPATDMEPRFNADVTRIAFASKRNGNYDIFTMFSVGTGLTQITGDSTDDVWPAWSPDTRLS